MYRQKNCATTIRDKTNLRIICLVKTKQNKTKQKQNKNKTKQNIKRKQKQAKRSKAKQSKAKQNKTKQHTNKPRTSSHKLSVSYEKGTAKDPRPLIKPWSNQPVWSKTTRRTLFETVR